MNDNVMRSGVSKTARMSMGVVGSTVTAGMRVSRL
jgi:hypothetical protein